MALDNLDALFQKLLRVFLIILTNRVRYEVPYLVDSRSIVLKRYISHLFFGMREYTIQNMYVTMQTQRARVAHGQRKEMRIVIF